MATCANVLGDRSREPGSPGRVPADEQIATRLLRDVADYVPRLRESARQAEQLGRVPESVVAELAAFGVFAMATPVEYGGLALSPAQQHRVITEVARGDGAAAWVVWVTQTSTQWMTQFDRRFQDELFGADWPGPLTAGVANQHGPGAARPVHGGYMLKGRFPFCSGVHHALFLHLGALSRDGDAVEPILCQVPTADAIIKDDWNVAGLRGTGSNTVAVEEEIFVPEHRVITVRELAGQQRRAEKPRGLLYDVHFIPLTASLNSAVALGMAQAAVEIFKSKIGSRGISHSRYGLQSEAPVTHLQLGELHCKLLAAELVARENVARVERWAQEGGAPDTREFARAKLETAYVNRIASEITDMVLRASGASSIHENNPLQRLFRDTRVTTMHGHTNIETCEEEFGRAETGLSQAVEDAQI